MDFSEFTPEATEEENQAWIDLDELPDPPWVTTIGHAGWVKGVGKLSPCWQEAASD